MRKASLGSAGARLFLATLGVFLALACRAGDGVPRERVRIGGESFELELAVTDAARERGLMRRSHLEPDGGMLFVFPDSRPRGFWMGHCLIDIDVIFLDARGRVTALHTMRVEPPQAPDEDLLAYRRRMPVYPSDGPARYVIELLGGTLRRLDLKVGDRIDLDLDRLPLLAR